LTVQARQSDRQAVRPVLRRGARVAVVSPASAASPEKVQRGVESLKAFGYEPVLMPHALRRGPLYYAGTAEERAADLFAALTNPEIEGVFCTRGGWGSAELLPLLDRMELSESLRARPKVFVGYSDHTSLHAWFWNECGLATFYGPMVAADWSLDGGADERTWCEAVEGLQPWRVGSTDGVRVLRDGPPAEGRLLGGCLAILETGLGTPYALRLDEPTVLFLEDINVKPYHWDRMLQHLRWAGMMDRVQGVVLGDMSANVGTEEMELLEAACLHALREVPGPVQIGLRSGHVTGGNRTVPLGAWVKMDRDTLGEVA
jgi:muramoyltetrapeptide carboxypeptidase